MTLIKGIKHAATQEDKDVLLALASRVNAVEPYQSRLREWCDRVDGMYYAPDITAGGADLWAFHRSVTDPGASHVSINLPATYVDVPAALQAVVPIENMLATDTTEEAREAAAALERVYVAWKQAENFDLKFHKAITVKSLYGLAAGRIYWDAEEDRVCVEIVEQPRNLYLGYQTSDYTDLEWAAYVTRYEPNALAQGFGVDVRETAEPDGTILPLVYVHSETDVPSRPWLAAGDAKVEVWDYWYRQPVWRGTAFVRMDTYNIVVAGNLIVRGPIKYPEYAGALPYMPVFNTFVPGLPAGRPDLYDVEQLLREKYEKVTAGSQMIANGVAGDYWQLIGPDAPNRVPPGLKPRRNELVAPGPGNRIEVITPFIAQFQLEQYLGRVDRELAAISGLNDLLLGLAPAQVLSSSKAIHALIANYESRLSIRRRILYKWRRDLWDLTLKVWAAKDKTVQSIVGKGAGFLDIIDPSLSPRDEQETAMRAANLVNAKLWTQSRGMDAVGVDDPEMEKQVIREESTDATLWPERVQVMAQLLGALQALGLQAPPDAMGQAQGQMTSGQADLRTALGAATPTNDQTNRGSQGDPASLEGQTPPLPGLPPEAGGPPAPFAAGPGQAAPPAVMQGMVQGGVAKGRIMTQQKLGRR
ncbi:MAG: hypothetical protein EXR69_12550 [Myxococcales bacterium]|nr:hypothetical protein [Myxococcales bacterium]